MEEKKYTKQGNQNLSNTDKANQFTDWMYGEIKPYIKGKILEVGSGIGTFSRKIINDFQDHKVFLSDIDPEYVKALENAYPSNENIQVIKLDLGKSSDFENINDKINTVIALNVLEHVKNDIDALNNIYNLLALGDKLILLVPAHKFLFNCIDASLDHFRRYTKKELLEKISHTEFRIKKIYYFNFPAMFGWYINGNIMKKNISEGSVSLFDRLVPIFKFFERYILRKKMGISLIAILEK